MKDQGIERPHVSLEDADDLIAYFFSIRYFEKPGEAERGKQVFESKHCAECHSLAEPAKGPGSAISTWRSLGDPILLVDDMWQHADAMQKALTEHKRGWVRLDGQELTDLGENLPGTTPRPGNFSLPDPASGEESFKALCAGCHKGAQPFGTHMSDMTLTEVAATMWNHTSRIKTAPQTSPEDMRKIVAYVWERQFLAVGGNRSKGARAFETKRCAICHNDPQSGAPHLPAANGVYTTVSMIEVLWTHGPQMLDKMQQRNLPWPRLTAEDVSDLATFLTPQQK
jgi:mono/diheme cytochrome c family protein